VRGTDEFGRATELRANAGGSYLCRRFPSTDEGAGIGIEPGTGFDWQRFSREHGLVELHRSVQQMHIRSHDAAKRQLDQVSAHNLGGGYCLPGAITAHGSVQCKSMLQRGERGLGAAFLKIRERCIENQEDRQ
jgi:hypothetical protein